MIRQLSPDLGNRLLEEVTEFRDAAFTALMSQSTLLLIIFDENIQPHLGSTIQHLITGFSPFHALITSYRAYHLDGVMRVILRHKDHSFDQWMNTFNLQLFMDVYITYFLSVASEKS